MLRFHTKALPLDVSIISIIIVDESMNSFQLSATVTAFHSFEISLKTGIPVISSFFNFFNHNYKKEEACDTLQGNTS